MDMKKGFTLAEVLITLSIIGVISVLTLPKVIEDTSKKVQVTQLQRAFNDLKSGVIKYLRDNETNKISQTPMGFIRATFRGEHSATTITNCPDSVRDLYEDTGEQNNACREWANQMEKNAVNPFLLGYLDIAVNCTEDASKCIASEYKNMNQEVQGFVPEGTSCVALETGATVCMVTGLSSTHMYMGRAINSRRGIKIYIDVNGKKSPNVLGRDAFVLELSNDGKIAESFDDTGIPSGDSSTCTTSENGKGCFTKIVADGWVMDY